MSLDTEKEMIKESNPKRLREMEKYGRVKTYKKINSFLRKDLREGFILTNHALAVIDDILDNDNKVSLDNIEDIFCRSFDGEKFVVKDKNIKKIQELGEILRKLHKKGFDNAYKIYLEILRYWKIDKKDRARKFKILSTKELDSLNKDIGGSIGKQFLFFLTPNLSQKTISELAISYGRAIKYADNLSDLNGDFVRGYINISKEDLKKHRLSLKIKNHKSIIIKGDLKDYKRLELYKIELRFNYMFGTKL